MHRLPYSNQGVWLPHQNLLAKMKELFIGVDIGGTRTRYGLVDAGTGTVYESEVLPTEKEDTEKFLRGLWLCSEWTLYRCCAAFGRGWYLSIIEEGGECYCGKRGCLEALVSSSGIINLAKGDGFSGGLSTEAIFAAA